MKPLQSHSTADLLKMRSEINRILQDREHEFLDIFVQSSWSYYLQHKDRFDMIEYDEYLSHICNELSLTEVQVTRYFDAMQTEKKLYLSIIPGREIKKIQFYQNT